jgi:hypothetical protein
VSVSGQTEKVILSLLSNQASLTSGSTEAAESNIEHDKNLNRLDQLKIQNFHQSNLDYEKKGKKRKKRKKEKKKEKKTSFLDF